jgi:hypothetical protein
MANCLSKFTILRSRTVYEFNERMRDRDITLALIWCSAIASAAANVAAVVILAGDNPATWS